MAPIWDWIYARGDRRVGVTTSRREQTTSTVIVSGRQALLVDPAWDPDELAAIAGDLAGEGMTVVAGFATHAHHDHLLWHPAMGRVPRWSSGPTARLARTRRGALLRALGPNWPADLADLVGDVTAAPGVRVPWDGPPVLMITHDAHSAGHTALWIPEAEVLVAGDMLSDVELPLLEESTATDYEAGLAVLEPYVARTALLVPGHGTVAVGPTACTARWRADRDYLRTLFSTVSTPPSSTPPSSTGTCSDPRLGNSGMLAVHHDNLSKARRQAR